MNMSALKSGVKLNIISRANVRYEGVFVQMNSDNLEIALSNVRFFGTEARAADFYMAPQARIYPYVLFKSSDILDIQVIDNPECEDNSDNFTDDFSQQSYELFRMAPFSNSSPKYISPNEKKLEARREMLRRCNQPTRHLSPYSWRIPPASNYASRSGDPTQLPLEFVDDVGNYDKEYDFEKYNRLFSDLCYGAGDMDLSARSNVAGIEVGRQSVQKVEAPNQSLPSDSDKSSLQDSMAIIDDAIANSEEINSSQKNVKISAYDKSKSFFDSVSCSSIYRSPYSNPNWREWNRETFGVPMIRHQSNCRRALCNTNKNADAINFDISSTEQEAAKENEKTPNSEVNNAQEEVMVQKIQFKAVIYTKSRGGKGEKKSVWPMDNESSNSMFNTRGKRSAFGDITNQQKENQQNI